MSEINTIKWQDLALENEPLRQQFMQYFREGYYFQALALITDNVDIDSETVMPEVFNMINTAITFLQNLYYNSVEVVLADDAQQFQMMIDNFINKKAFDATATYIPYNFVVYNQQIYMCIKETTPGILPTNTTYWLLIGLKGEDGATAIEVQLRYDWNYQTTYSPKDIVVYNNILYVAKTRNNNSQPDINPQDWEVFMTIPRAKVIVSPTEPLPGALDVGGEWWKIDTIYNTVESNTSSVTADDSSTDVIESISAYGNVSQVQSTGAQLLIYPFLNTTKTQDGITFIDNGDGSITINGTSTSTTDVSFALESSTAPNASKFRELLLGKNLVLSGNPVGGYKTGLFCQIWNYDSNNSIAVDNNQGVEFTFTNASAGFNITIGVRPGTTVNNVTFFPMLNIGNTAITWEPYTDGQVTPSPDYPSPIRGFGYSSNLLSFDEWYNTIILNNDKGITKGTAVWDLNLKKITITATADDCYTAFESVSSVSVYKIPVLPNTTYIFTWEYSGDAGRVYIFRNGIDSSNISTTNDTKKISIITNADTTFVTFRVGVTTAGTSCAYWNLMLYEIGDYASYFPSGEGKGVFKARTSGIQLFDASKLPTKSQGGATVTNNNDGSFTISGTGNLTELFYEDYSYNQEDTLKLITPGVYSIFNSNVYPRFSFEVIGTGVNKRLLSTTTATINITENDLLADNIHVTITIFGALGDNIVSGTVKPIVWKNETIPSESDWQPFSGIPTTAQSLIPSPLYKLNNTTDYLYREGNKWLIMHKVKKVILDGSIEYDVYNSLTVSKEIRPHGEEYYTNGEVGNVFFDRFKVVSNTWNSDKIGIGYGGAGSGSIFYIALRIPVDADPNEYMDAHPTTVIFIPPASQNYSLIEQFEDSEGITELEQLNSFYHTTELTISSQLEPTQIGLEYSADIPLYMQNNFN